MRTRAFSQTLSIQTPMRAFLTLALVASLLTFAPHSIEVAGAQSAGTTTISNGSGDLPISQVTLDHNGASVVQNSPAAGVVNSASTQALIETITITDGALTKVLDEFNFNGLQVRNQQWQASQAGVHTSQNGVHTEPDVPGFWRRVEESMGSADLRDYLDVGPTPNLGALPYDFDIYFNYAVDNSDYLVVVERNGNSVFELEAVDFNGNVIPGSTKLRFQPNYRWNTGFAPSDNTGQPMHLSVVDISQFGVNTNTTPIYGFRLNNDGEADLKLIAASDEVFEPQCPTGFYQVLSGRLNILNPVTGLYTPVDSGTVGSYNAMSYRISEGVFYAISSNSSDGSRSIGDVIRINASDGTIANTGLNVGHGHYTGDIDASTGLMHTSSGGANWRIVNLDTLTFTSVSFTSGDGEGRPSIADISVIDRVGYGMSGDRMGRYNLDTLTYETLDVEGITGVSGFSGGWGSSWLADLDQLYVANNATGEVIWIEDYTTNNPKGTRIANGQPTGNNDGASCAEAPDPFGATDALDDVADVYVGSPTTIDVLANDRYPAGALPRILPGTDLEGTLTVEADGTVTYTSTRAELTQTKTFSYELCPGDFASGHPRCDTAVATVSIVCPPGFPVEDRPPAITGAWSQIGPNTWRTQFGTGTVTATIGGSMAAAATTMEALDANDYSEPNVVGNPGLEITHDFPQSKQVTFAFSEPVINPVMHLSRLGGYSGWDPLIYSHSSLLTAQDGVTWSEAAANGPHFVTTANTVSRTPGTLLSDPTFSNGSFTSGMAGGSLSIDGTISELVLDFDATGQAFGNTADAIHFAFTEPAVQGCGGDASVQASKTANTDLGAVDGTVKWSFGTSSIGTTGVENATITDIIPDGLEPTKIRTGTWTPSPVQAVFEARVFGTWTAVANVRGNDDVTYNLPAGVDQVRVRFLDELEVGFRTIAPAKLTTRVVNPPMTGGVPDPILNCATWAGDNMSPREACDFINIELNKARPDLTLWNETGSAPPGSDVAFKVRIENAASATRDYVDPFVAILLPAELDFYSWQPMSSAEPPTFTATPNHNGSGRTLIRWNYSGASRRLNPGEVFDARFTTTVRAATPEGSFDLTALTGTNNTAHTIDCVDPETADVFDVDTDGVLVEPLCWTSTTFDVDVLFDVDVNAATKGRDDLDFVIWDTNENQQDGSAVDRLTTGVDTYIDSIPDAATGSSWSVSTTRYGTQSPAAENSCGDPLASSAPNLVDGDCNATGARWFQRTVTLDSVMRPDGLLAVGDASATGPATFYVNGVEQRPSIDANGSTDIVLTGPWNEGANLIEVYVEGHPPADGSQADPFTDLAQAHGVASGVYWFDLAGLAPFQGQVDASNGGGWVMVLNYVHQGGTNPALNARTTDLPISTGAALGADESGTAAWGHAAPAVMAALDGDEVRYYGQTSAHSRIIHFRSSQGMGYYNTGSGSLGGGSLVASNWTGLPGHTANLPASANSGYSFQGSGAMTEFPYFRGGADHWGIRGLGSRWEVDDFPNGPANHTIHRMWVRTDAGQGALSGPARLAADLTWYRVTDSGDTDAVPVNIARHSAVSQRTTTMAWNTIEGPPYADRAIDGNTDGHYWNGSVTHSAGSTNEWWQMDAGAVVPISTIDLFNRTDCCSERLGQASIFLSTVPFTSDLVADMRAMPGVIEVQIPDAPAPSYTINLNGAQARYVRIAQANNILQLAEVQVNTFMEPAVSAIQLDADWTVSETLDGPQRPAVSVARSCVPNWAAAPGGGSYIWGENCERPTYHTGTQAKPFTDLAQARDVPSGVYWFDLPGQAPFQAEVDASNGGGWVLVLNYVHDGGTNPALDVRTTDLPISTNATLGADESGTAAWGHAGNALMAALDADEVRFYGETNNHDRVIHFTTSEGLDYFETGTGSIDSAALRSNFTALDGHSAYLPAATGSTWTGQGDRALTEYPFIRSYEHLWGVATVTHDGWFVDDHFVLPNLDTGRNATGTDVVAGQAAPGWDVTYNGTTSPAIVTANCAGGSWWGWPAPLIWTGNCGAVGTAVFSNTFELPAAYDVSGLSLTAQTWVDNYIDSITINGVSQGVTDAGFQGTRTFTLNGPFQAGDNTIVVTTRNTGGPGALSINFTWNEASLPSAAARASAADTIHRVWVRADAGTGAPGSQGNPFVDISQAQDVPSGVYWFDLQGVDPFQAEVDNSQGGGWVLVANYVHQGGTNPALDVRTNNLPISTNAQLGADESGTNAWGHAGNALFAALDADEVRFYGETSGSDAVIHFRTFEGINYFETGTGSMDLDRLTSNFTPLFGHNSTLPAAATNASSNRGNRALTDEPFFHWSTRHWNIGFNGQRWEVDDYPGSPVNDTIHRVWVRSSDPWQGTSANTRENFTYYFHRDFDLAPETIPATLEATISFLVDNSVDEVWVNGVPQRVGGSAWVDVLTGTLPGPFQVGSNTITIAATNGNGPAAMAASIEFGRKVFSCPESNGHTSRPCVAQTTSHGPASLQLEMTNNGNVATGGLVAYNILPYLGDVSPLTGQAMNSDYAPTVTGLASVELDPASVDVVVTYSMSRNPCRPELFGQAAGSATPGGCDNDWTDNPADISLIRAIRVEAAPASGAVWEPGETLRVTLPIRAAQGSWERDETAFMPWAYVLDNAVGAAMAPVETTAAGLVVLQSQNGIGEWVWLDDNRNGVQDAGEQGINGVVVELYDSNRALVVTTTSQNLNNNSARAGSYWFGDLAPGEYFIKLRNVPISWNLMTPGIGFDDIDSNVNILTLEGPVVTVTLDGLILTQDIGFFVPEGPTACEDDRPEFDPTDTDADRRNNNDASQCPT